ncbi:uncharacterized protein LOC133806168 [Humulus lupulus]|uniref:uncharacterized protein LOC133806168 n=1 Tax=Humulus lupulus TaxID=3486 RepID=UPI002B404E7C|nr:uncharacterized protein LOC133806168 [Humulus lupulus]
MESQTDVSGSTSLLDQSVQCLSRRDFLGCRSYAVKAQESDPNIGADACQVIAVADVLHASERLKNNRLDYYSILQTNRTVSNDRKALWDQFVKLMILVNPKKNQFAHSMEAYKLLREAWMLLSDPEKKAQYDIEVGDVPEVPEQGGVPDHGNGSGEKSETFWTVCPFCYCMFEFEKVYEGCCLRCQTCRRGFHGVAISPPSTDIMVPGDDKYYFCYGVSSVDYSEEKNKANVNNFKKRKCCLDDHGVMEISDDDVGLGSLNDDSRRSGNEGKSNDSSSMDFKNGGDQDFVDGFWEEVLEPEKLGMHENESGTTEVGVGEKLPKKMVKAPARRMKNVKSVALKTKKIAGNRMRRVQTSKLVGDGDIAMGVASSEVNVDKGKGIMNGEDENEPSPWHEDAHTGLAFTNGEDDVFDGLLFDW